jgi:hypothetical protein
MNALRGTTKNVNMGSISGEVIINVAPGIDIVSVEIVLDLMAAANPGIRQ